MENNNATCGDNWMYDDIKKLVYSDLPKEELAKKIAIHELEYARMVLIQMNVKHHPGNFKKESEIFDQRLQELIIKLDGTPKRFN